MAVFDNAAWIGPRAIRPTEDQLERIENYDPGLYGVGLSALLRHLHYFPIHLDISTAIDANTKRSLEYTARFPFLVAKMEVGVESAAGSACTADIEKNPTGAPDTYATMSTGAVDVKTNAGNFLDLPVLDGAEEIAYGDQLQLVVAATGSGAVVGGKAILHCFRL